MSSELRPLRTVVGTLGGGVVGLLLLGAVGGSIIGPMLDLEGLAGLLPPLIGGMVGAVLGASFGLWFAFRDEHARRQLLTVATVLVPGLVLLAAAGAELVDVMVVHPVTLAVLLPVLALLGRFLATRGTHRDPHQDAAPTRTREPISAPGRTPSGRDDAAVDRQGDAGDVARGLGGQEHHG